jgi:hypothetical protein
MNQPPQPSKPGTHAHNLLDQEGVNNRCNSDDSRYKGAVEILMQSSQLLFQISQRLDYIAADFLQQAYSTSQLAIQGRAVLT